MNNREENKSDSQMYENIVQTLILLLLSDINAKNTRKEIIIMAAFCTYFALFKFFMRHFKLLSLRLK